MYQSGVPGMQPKGQLLNGQLLPGCRTSKYMGMKSLIVLSSLVCVISLGHAAEKASSPLPRSTPEAQGISSAGILDFIKAADEQVDSMNSFILLRHGQVVAEGWWSPYAAQSRHSLYSLSKSFTSTAVGLAIAEGKLSLDDEVLKFFPDDAPAEPSANLKAMRVRDLLRMNTGQHATDVKKFSFNSKEKLTGLFLSLPVEHKPGTHFFYNTPATYMASAIVQKVTGATVLDFLRPRLFEPLGIENPPWEELQGITFGGSGLSLRTEDIARFGQLYLQKGKWHGKQLVPTAWIEAATSRQTSNGSNPTSDWEQGYGFQFWRCRHGIYRGDGAFGQFCIVMPEQDAVVAITSSTRNLQGVLNLVWDKLLPAMKTGRLHADAGARKELERTLAGLTLPPQPGSSAPDPATKVSGRKYVFPDNNQKVEALALEFDDPGGEVTLVARCNGVEQRIACGKGTWRKARMTYAALAEQPVAASGAWTTDDTYTVKLSFYETPFCITASLKFSGDNLLFHAAYNLAFGGARQPQLTGKAQ